MSHLSPEVVQDLLLAVEENTIEVQRLRKLIKGDPESREDFGALGDVDKLRSQMTFVRNQINEWKEMGATIVFKSFYRLEKKVNSLQSLYNPHEIKQLLDTVGQLKRIVGNNEAVKTWWGNHWLAKVTAITMAFYVVIRLIWDIIHYFLTQISIPPVTL